MNIFLTRKSNGREITVNTNHILYIEDSDTGNKGSHIWFNDGQAMEVQESQDEIRHAIEAAIADRVRREEEVRARVNTVTISTVETGPIATLKYPAHPPAMTEAEMPPGLTREQISRASGQALDQIVMRFNHHRPTTMPELSGRVWSGAKSTICESDYALRVRLLAEFDLLKGLGK